MAVAELGIKVTTDAERAARELNTLTGASSKAETAAQELASKTTQAAAAAKGMASSAELEAKALNTASAAARTAANSNQQFARSMQATKFATANVAAQLNDIGVQLASGTSPFLVAIQQGTQLNQVFGQTGTRGIIGALGGAFLSLLNPVSLATIGIIGLGGVAVQYFTSLISGGEDSAKTLEDEAKLIQAVADKWGEALPALQAYNEERQKLSDQKAINDALGAAISRSYEEARNKVEELAPAVADLSARLREVGASGGDINALQDAFAALEEKLANNTATAGDVKNVLSLMFNDFATTGISDTYGLVDAFKALEAVLDRVSPKAAKLTAEQALAETNAKVSAAIASGQFQLPQLDPLGFIDPNRDQTNRANATQSQYLREQEKAAKAAARALKDASKEASKFPKVSRAAMQQAREMNRDAEQAARFWSGTAHGFVDDFVSGLEQGKSAWRAFADAAVHALQRIADKLLDQAFDGLFGARGGGGGGIFGFLGNLFGGGGGSGLSSTALAAIAGGAGGLYAKGGIFDHGISAYSNSIVSSPTLFRFARGTGLMGEAGPEGILPLRRNSAGQLGVIAANDRAANQNSRVQIDVAVHVNDDGTLGVIARQAGGEAADVRIQQYDKGMPARVKQINDDPRAR